jgi:hypothetical protein
LQILPLCINILYSKGQDNLVGGSPAITYATTTFISNPIPLDFFCCVPESQNVLNLLLQILVWDWLHKISLRPNSIRLLFLCFWITKCSKPFSSNSGFETDYIKSLSDPIPPDFCFCVLESQNAPNLLHMFLFCGTIYWAAMKVLWVIHIHHSQKF